MIVDHLNTGLRGGAAIAARRIHHGLLAQGVESRFWYSHRGRENPPDESYSRLQVPGSRGFGFRAIAERLASRLRRQRSKRIVKQALRGREPGLELFSSVRPGWRTPYDPRQLRGDILHLHWIANFIDYPTLFARLPTGLPVIWTLHDMNPFTGGCHYSGGCARFETGCGHCPQLGRPAADDLSRTNFRIKAETLRRQSLHVVADSHWLEAAARRSQLFATASSFRTIHYGLETETLFPRDRSAARQRVAIPHDCIVVGFGADQVATRRKGLPECLAALEMLTTNRRVIGLVFGSGELPVRRAGEVELRSVGFVGDLTEQAWLYSAMDLFLMPSLEEAFGMTGLEAMSCGVPVVGFAAGGIPDYVRPPQTGLLAKTGDVPRLASLIDTLADDPDLRAVLGREARAVVEREFTAARQTRDYLDLYKSVMADSPALEQRAA